MRFGLCRPCYRGTKYCQECRRVVRQQRLRVYRARYAALHERAQELPGAARVRKNRTRALLQSCERHRVRRHSVRDVIELDAGFHGGRRVPLEEIE